MPTSPTAPGTLKPPKGGAIVRMYRIGHGDCFLIAFAGKTRTHTVLIDCGCKPGSLDFIPNQPEDVVDDIRKVTGGKVDVLVITHEHQDHVNAIGEKLFDGIEFGQLWLAWTEKSNDPLAKKLKKKYGKKLADLQATGKRLPADSIPGSVIDKVLELERGFDDSEALKFGKHSFTGETSVAKAMKFARGNSKSKRHIYPHEKILALPEVDYVRVFPLGPPHEWDKITDLEPDDDENFRHFGGGEDVLPDFSAAISAADKGEAGRPFAPRYGSPIRDGKKLDSWYAENYGDPKKRKVSPSRNSDFLPKNVSFRRIEEDWLGGSVDLALRIGRYTNNSSLVLAFELGRGGKVLLFAADAQRGNWASWADAPFKDDDGTKIDVKDLLARTVLYKTGHHGSHNATLKGDANSKTPTLGWLGTGSYADEFTAMITAVRDWATQDSVDWDHPLKAIKDALLDKSEMRVLQTDTDLTKKQREPFDGRLTQTRLYFDLRIDP